MGGGKKSKAPAAPDYAAAAKAQGAADLQTAQYTTAMDRPSQYSPYGNITWQFTGKDLKNPQAGDWQQRMSLSPQEQAIFNREQQNRLGMEGLAGTAIGQASRTIGSQFSPKLREFMNPQAYQWSRVGLPGNTLANMKDVNEGTQQFQQQGDQVRDAMYQQMTRFSNERFGEEEAQERSRLQQLGLQEGTAAYQNALQEFRRSKDESYQGAQLASILAGGQEQSRMVADQLAARASNMGLRQGQFDQNAARYGMDQGERQFQAGNQLDLANLYGQQRQQQFGEQSYMRSLPINEISALLNGGGVNMPQMPGFAQSQQFNSPDMLGATQAQYNAQLGAYNSRQQGKGSLLGAGASLAGGFLGGK